MWHEDKMHLGRKYSPLKTKWQEFTEENFYSYPLFRQIFGKNEWLDGIWTLSTLIFRGTIPTKTQTITTIIYLDGIVLFAVVPLNTTQRAGINDQKNSWAKMSFLTAFLILLFILTRKNWSHYLFRANLNLLNLQLINICWQFPHR